MKHQNLNHISYGGVASDAFQTDVVGRAWVSSTLVRSVLSLTVLYVRQTIHHSQLSWSLISCTVTATMCAYCPDPFHLLHRAHAQQHMTMLIIFMHRMDCIMGCEYLVPATNTMLIQYNCGFVTNTEHLQNKTHW